MPRRARQARDALTGTRLLEDVLYGVLILGSVAAGLALSGWFYGVHGRRVELRPGSVVTPLGRYTFDRAANVVRAETKVGDVDFAAAGTVSILAVPRAEQALLGEIASLHVGLADLLPAFRDSRLTLTIGLRAEGRFLPLLALSQRRISDVLHGADPPFLTTIRALGLARDIHDVAMELRASFIEAFREQGLVVEFDENV